MLVSGPVRSHSTAFEELWGQALESCLEGHNIGVAMDGIESFCYPNTCWAEEGRPEGVK